MPFRVVASSADPEGGTGGPDPLENHKLYGFQQGISNWTPPSWKKLDPPPLLENVGPTLLGPCINGLVTDGNTKICCRGFILVLPVFQSSTAYKIDSVHTRDYKRLLPVWEAEILRVTVK